MGLERPAFTPMRTEEERSTATSKVFTVRLNLDEQAELKESQKLLHQPKDGTALKQLALLGSYVLHDRSMAHLLNIVKHNIKKNKRSGREYIE